MARAPVLAVGGVGGVRSATSARIDGFVLDDVLLGGICSAGSPRAGRDAGGDEE